MESINDVKKRIKSVSNTQQITKAMEVVSATKMRRSQELALSARPYAFSAFELLSNLLVASKKISRTNVDLPPLFLKNKAKKMLFLVITSDKSLAGPLNSNVLKKAYLQLAKYQEDMGKENVDVALIGKKATEFFSRRKVESVKNFSGHGDYISFDQVQSLSEFLSQAFIDKKYKKIITTYTNFLSTLKQEPVSRQLLPFSRESLLEMIEGLAPELGKYAQEASPAIERIGYLFEPTVKEVLNSLSSRLFQMMVYHITLEANASEHSARMVAMKTASENAEELVGDLTLLYNKRRQAKITQEIIEITSGSGAVSNE